MTCPSVSLPVWRDSRTSKYQRFTQGLRYLVGSGSADQIGALLGHRHDRDIGIDAGQFRHRGRVDHPQIADAFTRSSGSRTAIGSVAAPILAVPAGWYTVLCVRCA